jgi:hypothetical protein
LCVFVCLFVFFIIKPTSSFCCVFTGVQCTRSFSLSQVSMPRTNNPNLLAGMFLFIKRKYIGVYEETKKEKKKRIKTFKMCCSFIDILVLDIWKSTNERVPFVFCENIIIACVSCVYIFYMYALSLLLLLLLTTATTITITNYN